MTKVTDEYIMRLKRRNRYMVNRYVCDALSEMRDHIAKMEEYWTDDVDEELQGRLKFQRVLLEEVQTHVNRMEAALHDNRDLENLRDEVKDLKRTRRRLERQIKELEEEYEEEGGE